jgi:hypothetical protein
MRISPFQGSSPGILNCPRPDTDLKLPSFDPFGIGYLSNKECLVYLVHFFLNSLNFPAKTVGIHCGYAVQDLCTIGFPCKNTDPTKGGSVSGE